jgi:hypothetical protein
MNGKIGPDLNDFSLVRSGIFYKLLLQLRLAGTSTKEIRTRILVIVTAAWLPLLILGAMQALAFGD